MSDRMMVSKDKDPVGWALLMYELEDAQEHRANLINAMATDPEYDEPNLRIDLGHIYSHLNRAWHRRNAPQDLPDSAFEAASQFPADLEPL